MKKWNILSFADLEHCPRALDCLNAVADVTSLPPSQAALRDRLPAFDAYIPGLPVRLTGDIIAKCPNLRAVATPSTGTDHLDVAALAERGVRLLGLKDDTEFLSRITSTAEMAWALLLAVVRKLPWSFDAARQGIWARDRFRGHQLSGMTLGVLGYGRLGRIVADYGLAFRMRVLACDVRSVSVAPGVDLVDFDTLIRQSDVLSVHIHLTPENTGLISRDVLSRMKSGAILLNTSRGAIVDEAALVETLESGHLSGAGLDVIHGEWDSNLAGHPLIRYANAHDNMVISPHTGGGTYEAQAMTLEFTARKLLDYLRSLD